MCLACRDCVWCKQELDPGRLAVVTGGPYSGSYHGHCFDLMMVERAKTQIEKPDEQP